jgi:hypothetical protein
MNPYISIVVVARNDNYGGDFLQRISVFMRSLGRQAEQYPRLMELVIVEWNPPTDRPRLADALAWPPYLAGRIITVPKEAHDQVTQDNGMPVLEFFGKNVGIRRSRGNFTLVTNADIIFTDELVAEFAKRRLQQGTFYRVDRYDYDGHGIDQIATEDLIAFASSRVNFAHIRHNDDVAAAISMNVLPGTDWVSRPRSAVLPGDETHENGSVVECNNDQTQLWGLHTNASGDFILAPRQAWLDCKGFWERADTFTHLDSYCVCRMRGIGLRQTLFRAPLTILHLDHVRTEQAGRPKLSWPEVLVELEQLRVDPNSLGYARQRGWGLETSILREVEPATFKPA